MVRRISRNPLLKGMPGRGFKHTVKHNETGRRISVKNPNGPIFREYPHLAHVMPADFDEVNALLDARNARYKRKPVNSRDPLWAVPRKRTRFPGQHASCWYCGRQYVWGGNGVTENLMCCGARESRCWNSIGFNGALAAERLVKEITAELYKLDGLDAQFRALVVQAMQDDPEGVAGRWDKLTLDEKSLVQQKENLLAAITTYGPKPMFESRLADLESSERELARERRELESLQKRALKLPESITDLRQMLAEQFQLLAIHSPEFGTLMRQLVPQFSVHLVRLLDGGHPLPRARVTLNLGGIIPDARYVPALERILTRELTLDLFYPPQRERIREEAARLEAQGFQQREIGRRLSEKPKQAAVQRALALNRKMHELGLDSPYVLMSEPPRDYPKLRRHKNPKYEFIPLEGYQRPLLEG
jgi:hypothetical protein